MIDIGVAGENRNTILIIAAVMATLAILRLCVCLLYTSPFTKWYYIIESTIDGIVISLRLQPLKKQKQQAENWPVKQ